MPESSYDSRELTVQRDSTKIYFFVIAILALVATNIYFYVKYKTSNEQVTEVIYEKIGLQAEIDRIEIELNRLDEENLELSQEMQLSRDSAQLVITTLREQLSTQGITAEELEAARKQVDELRVEVSRYAGEIGELRQENSQLIAEQDRLQETIREVETRADMLQEENTTMVEQLRVASALKVSNMGIVGVRERSRGREEPEVRTRRIDRFDINFTIADNPLSDKALIEVYLRVIDPNGNLRTPEGNQFFVSGNDRLQYTYKTSIEFSNDGKLYNLEWRDNQPFQKGTYTVLLYSDEGPMGRSSIILR